MRIVVFGLWHYDLTDTMRPEKGTDTFLQKVGSHLQTSMPGIRNHFHFGEHSIVDIFSRHIHLFFIVIIYQLMKKNML
jgi:hypothetical protein